jgi:hypothetical protein
LSERKAQTKASELLPLKIIIVGIVIDPKDRNALKT